MSAAERIQWGAARLLWTGGDDFQLELPAAIEVGPANWLNVNLGRLLSAGLNSRVQAEVTPARRSNGGFSDFGLIAIGPLRRPFPMPGVLHKTISDAVTQAFAEAEAAEAD